MKVLVIGGGAAGFFTAINIAQKQNASEVTILEKSNKLLSKVLVSGGGRCNVTNEREKPSELVHFYPRGHKKLHTVFKKFTTSDMVKWLESRGVEIKAEGDHRMFPKSNSSQSIIDCFKSEADKHGVSIHLKTGLTNFYREGDQWVVQTDSKDFKADVLVIATGSSQASWNCLKKLEIEITPPVPSLFTFNIKDDRIGALPGVSFSDCQVKVVGTKLLENGPLLITHWGLSGPAILKLSSWGARQLNVLDYHFEILVNYLGGVSAEKVGLEFKNYGFTHPKRKVSSHPLFGLPKRFWEQLTQYCGITSEVIHSDISKKQTNKLIEELTQGRYSVQGKSTFKEEFVTSGGVKLNEINLDTFESKKHKNLFFAGEVLDIDALTGGFNFQACWSGGWIISENI